MHSDVVTLLPLRPLAGCHCPFASVRGDLYVLEDFATVAEMMDRMHHTSTYCLVWVPR